MKKWIPFLLLFGFVTLHAQDEVERIHGEAHFASGDNENDQTTRIRFRLTEHFFPTTDSVDVRIRAYITNPRFAEADKLNYKAPFPDAYLSAAQLDAMLKFITERVQAPEHKIKSIYWKNVTEGLRIGVQLGPNRNDKKVIFELWEVRKPYDFERFIARSGEIAALNRRAQALVEEHQLQQ